MAVTTTKTNKPLNPRGNDQSPKGYNRAELYSGKALDFDGVNDLVTISDGINSLVGDEITLTAWVRLDAVSGYPCIISNKVNDTNGFAFLVNPTGNELFWQYDGASYQIEAGGELTLGELYFVCATYDGSNLKTYINGVESVTKAAPSKALTATGDLDLYIGRQNTATGYWNGLISGLRAFNVALTAAQVADLYNNPEKIVPTGVADSALKLYLPMMEGAGTTAYDGSGNGNHGTISGATWTHGIGAPVAQTAVIDWNKGTNETNYSDIQQTASSAVARNWVEGSQNPWTPSNATGPTGLANSAGTYTKSVGVTQNDYLYNSQIPVTSGETYTMSAWVKLGTASNAVFVVNNSVAWDSISGANYVATAANGYDEWKQVSITFTAPSYGKINIHIGYHEETGVTAQADGTFYVYGVAIHKGSTPILVPTNGTAQTSDVLLPQGLTTGRDITGVNLFENVRKQGALNLDGNSWAEVHDNASLDMASEISIEAWVYKRPDTSSYKQIINKIDKTTSTDYYGVWVNNASNGFLFESSTGSGTNSTNGLSATDWNHLVVTYDGTSVRFYIDGSLDKTAARSVDLSNDYHLLIGGGRSGQYFDNQIAQPRIYNRALTAEEVERNYNAGKNIYK